MNGMYEYKKFNTVSEIVKLYLKSRLKIIAGALKRAVYRIYNYLTMNEIFTHPNSKIDDVLQNRTENSKSWKKKVSEKKYWLATFVFFIKLVNDCFGYQTGFNKYGPGRTLAHYFIMILTLWAMFELTKKCESITQSILYRYNDFKEKNFKLITNERN